MKRIFALTLVLVLLSSCGLKTQQVNARLNRYTAEIYGAFNTVITFTAYCENREEFETLHKEVTDEFMHMHRLFDRYNTYPAVNNIKTINDNAGTMPTDVDKRLTELLLFAKDMYASTDGIVNVMLGDVLELWRNSRENNLPPPKKEELMKANGNADIENLIVNKERSTVFIASGECSIDVGAIAKGFAVGKVSELIRDKGVENFLINCGSSSIGADGIPTGKDAWNIGIQNPTKKEQEIFTTVSITDQAVGTSGDYQNYYTYKGQTYHHLIDPETLQPATNFKTVTVICENCAIADALSTAIFIADEEKGNELADKYEARVIRMDSMLNVSEYKGAKKDAEL